MSVPSKDATPERPEYLAYGYLAGVSILYWMCGSRSVSRSDYREWSSYVSNQRCRAHFAGCMPKRSPVPCLQASPDFSALIQSAEQ